MTQDIIVPSMGESITEAKVVKLLVEEDSYVEEGQEVLELETDKVNQVLSAPADGTISFAVQVEDTVRIGQKVASIQNVTKKPPDKEEVVAPIPAKENAVLRTKMSSFRKTIADRLVAVKNTTAMLTTFNEVDMTEVIRLRSEKQEAFIAQFGVKLGLMSFFVKASMRALMAYPIIHSYIEKQEIVTPTFYDIGIAVATDRGVIVPVLRHCEDLSFGEIEQKIANYATKAREGKISIDDLKEGSFTITNGGVFGSLLSTPIINPPQSAILGMHAILKRPIAVEDTVVIRPMMYLALSYDHRLIDGKEAVLFLAYIKNLLEHPEGL